MGEGSTPEKKWCINTTQVVKRMIHPAIYGVLVWCQVLEDICLFPFRTCLRTKDTIKKALLMSVSMNGYTAQEI